MPGVPLPQQWPHGPSNPLQAAADCGSFKTAANLLASGAFDIDQGNEVGWTPLMMASRGGYPRIVRMLLNKGAQLWITDDLGYTALHWSAMAGHLAVTKMLVDAGAPLEAATKQNHCTPLDCAAETGCAASVTALLEAGSNLNTRRSDGATPLYTAAWNGNVGAVWLLLFAKADPLLTCASDSGKERFLPLDVAAQNGHREVVHELIRQVGIDECGGSSGGENALRQAALFSRLDIMAILTDAGVVDTGLALVVAAGYGGEAPLKFLLEQARARKTTDRVAYMNTLNGVGLTSLLDGIQRCRPRVVRLLVEAGADTTSPVLICNQPGAGDFHITPLGLTMCLLGGRSAKPLTMEKLNKLEVIRRLLLREEAVHAVSWLWPSDIPTIVHATAKGTSRTTATSTAATPLIMLMMRRRTRGRKGPLAALLRYSWKVETLTGMENEPLRPLTL
ncbi:unnamed protein product [Ectocarpus sp. 12 AP-2014]